MPRFVILRHETPPDSPRPSHFDLMLEAGGALQTWALDQLPLADESIIAQRLPDHRLAYLDFEGEVAAGRGSVSRVDAGQCLPLSESATGFSVELQGSRCRGRLELVPLNDGTDRWRLTLGPAKPAA